MNTNFDVNSLKMGTNLVNLVSGYTRLHKEGSSEFAGACPKCGGTDRLHVTPEMFFCRQCYQLGNGKPHDAIAFVQWVNTVDFKTACVMLSGENMLPEPTFVEPVEKQIEYNWNAKDQLYKIRKAHKELVAGETKLAQTILEYLIGRGFGMDVIQKFQLGCRMTSLPNTWDKHTMMFTYPKQPSVLIPWFDQDGALVAIKYRFAAKHTYLDVNKRERTENKTSRGNFAGHLFGRNLLSGADTVIVCEGELNAISLYQAGDGRVDVLSTGTESTLPKVTFDEISQYKRRIVWADKREIADRVAYTLKADSMCSLVVDEKSYDANDFLQAGLLNKLLDKMLGN